MYKPAITPWSLVQTQCALDCDFCWTCDWTSTNPSALRSTCPCGPFALTQLLEGRPMSTRSVRSLATSLKHRKRTRSGLSTQIETCPVWPCHGCLRLLVPLGEAHHQVATCGSATVESRPRSAPVSLVGSSGRELYMNSRSQDPPPTCCSSQQPTCTQDTAE